MRYNRPCFVTKPTESIYDDKQLYPGKKKRRLSDKEKALRKQATELSNLNKKINNKRTKLFLERFAWKD